MITEARIGGWLSQLSRLSLFLHWLPLARTIPVFDSGLLDSAQEHRCDGLLICFHALTTGQERQSRLDSNLEFHTIGGRCGKRINFLCYLKTQVTIGAKVHCVLQNYIFPHFTVRFLAMEV